MSHSFRTFLSLDRFKRYGNFAKSGGFGLVVELHWKGSATNAATLSSFCHSLGNRLIFFLRIFKISSIPNRKSQRPAMRECSPTPCVTCHMSSVKYQNKGYIFNFHIIANISKKSSFFGNTALKHRKIAKSCPEHITLIWRCEVGCFY